MKMTEGDIFIYVLLFVYFVKHIPRLLCILYNTVRKDNSMNQRNYLAVASVLFLTFNKLKCDSVTRLLLTLDIIL